MTLTDYVLGRCSGASATVFCDGTKSKGGREFKMRAHFVAAITYATSAKVLAVINAYITAENANLANWNSTDPATEVAGIQATEQAANTFASQIQGLNFRSSDVSDAKALVSAATVYAASLGSLAANVPTDSDYTEYNQIYNTSIIPDSSALQAAVTTLGNDFGLSFTATPTP
ncbi:MAG: hypothetical protein WA724_03465 [Candidatus Dormiibacterota bacterium]